ncbi:AIM24 family protein [Leptolyngbya subtilissima DQ-A4]|uniref:AIM24 family protein n=1 Tax=Leptolyngbya subtilissima DQ-A4 TaxID=2933933 RepID=A0ABV0K3S2_9CYAN
MANFEVIEREGTRLVKITLNDETVRTESGALHYMRGAIAMQTQTPSAGGFLKSLATGKIFFVLPTPAQGSYI